MKNWQIFQLSHILRQLPQFVKISLPPVQGVFYEGQFFEAYIFASNLIKSAKKSIVLIDNYIDESVLLLLSKQQIALKKQQLIIAFPHQSLFE